MAFNFSPKIVSDGLVLYMDAANPKSYAGSGTVWNDLSRGQNRGTLTNGPTFNSANGGSISFDGVDDYVNMGDKFSINQGTIDFWIKLNVTVDNTSTSINYRPFGKTDAFECRWNKSATFGVVGSLQFDFGQSTSSLISTQSTWSNLIWYNIVFNWNSSINQSNLYIQSTLNNTGTALSITGQTGNFSVGASRGGSQGFINGRMSNFKIYNRALSAQEVQQNFNATRQRFGV